MPAPVPLLQQPPGSNRCLPTAIQAVLQRYGDPATLDEISAWCAEGANGCSLDEALQGLRAAEFDVGDLSGKMESALIAAVTDEVDPCPVVVTILPHPRYSLGISDHAVVVVNVRIHPENGGEDEVVYMDPLTGRNESALAATFWQWWDHAGRTAFTIRP